MRPLITLNEKVAVDTNIVIYAIENQDSVKKNIALELFMLKPYISNQVISESINVLHRKHKENSELCLLKILKLFDVCDLIINTEDVYYNAKFLMKKYKLNLYDSIVVANALIENCSILYTEDMYEVLIEKKC